MSIESVCHLVDIVSDHYLPSSYNFQIPIMYNVLHMLYVCMNVGMNMYACFMYAGMYVYLSACISTNYPRVLNAASPNLTWVISGPLGC